ncbi:MAG TPA: hypothetical protein VKS81_01515, partial [Bacteroidota bacterium]|nr:hypothetical protein [Bacteroidota bacterium]
MHRIQNKYVVFSYLKYCYLFLIFLSLPARAQWINDPAAEAKIHRGIQQVYNLSFDSAKVNFNEIIRQYPDHPEGYFFLGMVGWWNIMIDLDNEANDPKFLSSMERVIAICDKRLDKNDTDLAGLFFKGGALGFEGRLYANREDWLKAAGAGKSAMDLVMKADKLSPNNHDIELGLGIYNYYASVIPDQYPIVKPFMLLFPAGDKQKGIAQLYDVVHQAKYASEEGSYFLL